MKHLGLVKFLSIVLCAWLLAAPAAHATSASDSWWNANESGWGMTVIQQDAAFGFAMYVYDETQTPYWFLGAGSGGINGGWTGELRVYSGPFYGNGIYNANAVGSTVVGTFTFTLTAVNAATFTYSVNGVTFTKSVSRLAVANDRIQGSYVGAIVSETYSCSATSGNGSSIQTAQFVVSQSGTTASIVATINGGPVCTYTGNYAQQGRYGSLGGTFSCPGLGTGTFQMFEMDSNSQALSGRYTANATYNGVTCLERGRMGGIAAQTSSF